MSGACLDPTIRVLFRFLAVHVVSSGPLQRVAPASTPPEHVRSGNVSPIETYFSPRTMYSGVALRVGRGPGTRSELTSRSRCAGSIEGSGLAVVSPPP